MDKLPFQRLSSSLPSSSFLRTDPSTHGDVQLALTDRGLGPNRCLIAPEGMYSDLISEVYHNVHLSQMHLFSQSESLAA